MKKGPTFRIRIRLNNMEPLSLFVDDVKKLSIDIIKE